MIAAFLKFLIIASTVFFTFNALTYGQWREAFSGYAHPSREEERSEKFPVNKTGIETADDDDIALQHHGFSLVNLEAEIAIRYAIPRTHFPSRSYCKIPTPPPWI